MCTFCPLLYKYITVNTIQIGQKLKEIQNFIIYFENAEYNIML